MRINQVEELVGISKKNIRFYEEKGLLSPRRTAENGYRDYSEEDVENLLKIKLLRQLSIPIEEILKVQSGYLTLEDLMRRHIIVLDREEENLKQRKSICEQIKLSGVQLGEIDTELYFERIHKMEQEGVRFMNVEQVDRHKKRGPIIATIVMIAMMVVLIGILTWAAKVDPIPIPFLLFIMAMPVAVIVGVLLALKERMKQIEGGEEDAARKY